MGGIRMVPLLTVPGGFQAKVVAARLGSEGIVTELRGGVDGPYPVGDVQVLVSEDDFDFARQLLLADEVEEALAAPGASVTARSPTWAPKTWLIVVAIAVVWLVGVLSRYH